jgi:tetratricopeptide (TPR) repeat protein
LPLVKTCIYENWYKTTRTSDNDPIVKISLHFRPDGTLDGEPKVITRISNDVNFSRLAATALDAITKCVPLRNMPPGTYYIWKDVVLQFATRASVGEALAPARQGNEYLAKGQFDHAIAEYSRAIQMAPDAARYYNARAWAYLKAGKPTQGLPDVRKALELAPHDARALDTRGSIFEALGRREEAIRDFRRAISLGVNDPEVQASGRAALNRLGSSVGRGEP